MSATRCTCVRTAWFRSIVLDPECPAYGIHVLNPEQFKSESQPHE